MWHASVNDLDAGLERIVDFRFFWESSLGGPV
jgi:hypothetical protein